MPDDVSGLSDLREAHNVEHCESDKPVMLFCFEALIQSAWNEINYTIANRTLSAQFRPDPFVRNFFETSSRRCVCLFSVFCSRCPAKRFLSLMHVTMFKNKQTRFVRCTSCALADRHIVTERDQREQTTCYGAAALSRRVHSVTIPRIHTLQGTRR